MHLESEAARLDAEPRELYDIESWSWNGVTSD